jgi:N-carbamoylputrescine amidase
MDLAVTSIAPSEMIRPLRGILVPMARALRVAAVQMECRNGDVAGNLARATAHVEEAARRGAELVLLPELLAAGYELSEAIWDAGEPSHGPTARWLAEQSRRHRIHLGASFLEAEDEDFYNTFVLTTPSGDEAGRVRKQTPALFEAYFTRGGAGPHVIRTELGVIGVGICYENQLAYLPQLLTEGDVDLVLMPHSAPSPARGFPWIQEIGIRRYEDLLRTLPAFYARALGVPVVMTNKCGQWKSSIPGLPFLRQRSRFGGFSAIADGNGDVKTPAVADERVLVADVHLDAARKSHVCPPCSGRWSRAMPIGAVLARVPEILGARWYARSEMRRRKARALSRARVKTRAHDAQRPN